MIAENNVDLWGLCDPQSSGIPVDAHAKIRQEIHNVDPVLKNGNVRRWALIVVDVQNDFITGTMALDKFAGGEEPGEVIPAINRLLSYVNFDLIIYSRDWHPPGHCSFVQAVLKQPILNVQKWPRHCVKGEWGAEFHRDLEVHPPNTKIFHVLKGDRVEIESLSAFGGTIVDSKEQNLAAVIQSEWIDTLFVCGLATDFCVFETCKDARKYLKNLDTYLIFDCCRGTKNFTHTYQSFLENQVKLTTSDRMIKSVLTSEKKLHPKRKIELEEQKKLALLLQEAADECGSSSSSTSNTEATTPVEEMISN